jgi:ATPase subunit of ABC transporter with duplicated ATPase domains
MPASISLHHLSYSTPDGQPLLSDLSLTFGSQRTGLVGRNGTGKSTLLRLMLGELAPLSGTIEITGTLGMLRQTVQAPHAAVADALGVAAALALLDRIERGEGTEADFADADWQLPTRITDSLERMGLPALDPDRPVGTLSGGQLTRLSLAGLLIDPPDIMLLDEPTNNLDADGRDAVAELLGSWRGAAIVVSHDRTLLDGVDAIVELTSLGAGVYGGNWTSYRAQKDAELATAQADLGRTRRRVDEIGRRVQQQIERKARRDGAGARQAARGGMPRILLGARKENAENSVGNNARLASRQQDDAQVAAEDARARVEVLTPLTISLPTTGLPAGRTVLIARNLSGGHHPNCLLIRNVDLAITGPQRIAVAGANGAGKTTLLRLLTGALQPASGEVRITPRHALLDQRLSLLDPARDIAENFRALNPDADENSVRAALARFMFRADAALQPVGTLSGGEMLRAGLAATIGGTNPPELLLLDEPTNHLDIHALEELEAGLVSYDGALVVVSHDPAFLRRIAITETLLLPGAPMNPS